MEWIHREIWRKLQFGHLLFSKWLNVWLQYNMIYCFHGQTQEQDAENHFRLRICERNDVTTKSQRSDYFNNKRY